ncbi:MAG: alpha/beta hydrolase [Burkholderiales bacterium]|nr:alpha/beta hydrolase [Burkholderiales bacterium]
MTTAHANAGANPHAVDDAAATRLLHAQVDGLDVAYREAGDPRNPAFVLLHGFPSSSFMFRRLIPLLAPRFHVIAPDYIGFGDSAAPPATEFAYTFDALTAHVTGLLAQLGIERHYLYMQDYGGPIGLRMASARPHAILGLVVQNANSYLDGIGALTGAAFTALWQGHDETGVRWLLTPQMTQHQYTAGSRDPAALDPATWTRDSSLLSRPGSDERQVALFRDYQSNVARYPKWQAYLRDRQPRTLVVWGDGDPLFTPAGADAYGRDLRDIAIHHLNTGHFALEEDVQLIAQLTLDFFARSSITTTS